MAGLRRYNLIARGYDLISLERWLYAAPRARALELLGVRPGGTVLDLGCGTGLNFPLLLDDVGQNGRLLGVDASAGMLAGARKRVRTAGWDNVTLLQGDVTDLAGVLSGAGVEPTAIDGVTATYVLSLLTDDTLVWRTLTAMAAARPLRVALTDIGPPAAAPRCQQPAWRLLARLGGARPRTPWRTLTRLADDTVVETAHGGHVRIAVGTLQPGTLPASTPGRQKRE